MSTKRRQNFFAIGPRRERLKDTKINRMKINPDKIIPYPWYHNAVLNKNNSQDVITSRLSRTRFSSTVPQYN